jgi:hypothetical protein
MQFCNAPFSASRENGLHDSFCRPGAFSVSLFYFLLSAEDARAPLYFSLKSREQR